MKNYIILILFSLLSLTSCGKEKVFEKNKNNVFQVKCYNLENESFGSATVIAKEGLLVTNFHVVSYTIGDSFSIFENIELKGYYDSEYLKAEIIKYDYYNDLAILKVDKEFSNIKTNNVVNELDEVYAIGNLNNNGICITKGSISNSNINMEYLGVINKFYQADITVSNGNSGCGLYNDEGELIGIVTFRLRDSSGVVIQGIAYIIPIERCLTFLNAS